MNGKFTYASLVESFGEPIATSPFAKDIAEDDWVRVPEGAQDMAGFTWPVALSASVHGQCVMWSPAEAMEEHRLEALLRAARTSISGSRTGLPVSFQYTFASNAYLGFEVEGDLTVSFGHDGGKPLVIVLFSHEG